MQFASGAARRDRERLWPVQELDAFSQSGLWSINVPKAYGGPELSYVTLNRIIEIIAAADPSLGQIPQNHLGVVAAIRTVSDEPQKRLLFSEVLRGTRFGNAFSEFGSRRAAEFETKFIDAGDQGDSVAGKRCCTGTVLWQPSMATKRTGWCLGPSAQQRGQEIDAPKVAQQAVTYAREHVFERAAIQDERAILQAALERSMGQASASQVRQEFERRAQAKRSSARQSTHEVCRPAVHDRRHGPHGTRDRQSHGPGQLALETSTPIAEKQTRTEVLSRHSQLNSAQQKGSGTDPHQP